MNAATSDAGRHASPAIIDFHAAAVEEKQTTTQTGRDGSKTAL